MDLIMFRVAILRDYARFSSGKFYRFTLQARRERFFRSGLLKWAANCRFRISIEPVTFTPTFVWVDNGVEVGRFSGYFGKEKFFSIVNKAANARQRRRSAENKRAAFRPPAASLDGKLCRCDSVGFLRFGAFTQRVKIEYRLPQTIFHDMRVDLRRRDIGVSEESLQHAQVDAAVKEVRCEGMAQHVRR